MPSAERIRYAASLFMGMPVAALYALLVWFAFGNQWGNDIFGRMTIGFLFVAPFVVGAIAVSVAPRESRMSYGYGTIAALVSCTSGLVLLAVLALEGAICVVMLAPAALIMAVLGGVLATWVARRLTRPEQQSNLALLFALLPFIVTPLESRIVPEDSFHTVAVRQEIRADAATVWYQITHFDPIAPAEHRPSAFHLLGLPKPVSATLMGAGPGVIRRGVYENGLTFREVVTAWEPERTFGFTIALDPEAPIQLPYGGIGGPYLDISSARYTIEPAGNGTVVLVLESEHRVTTRFNTYSGAWTAYILADLQSYLLRIVKDRAEAARDLTQPRARA
jgi:hypothetical protein